MQQFLQAQKIPGRLGGIGRQKRIGQLLERRVPEQRHHHQRDHQNLKTMASRINRCGKAITLRANSPVTLAEVFLVMKTMRSGSFLRVGAEASFVFIFFAHLPSRTVRPPSF